MRAKVFEIRDWEVEDRPGSVLEEQLNSFLENEDIHVHSFHLAPVVLPPTEARGFSKGAGVNGVLYATILYES